MELMELMIKNGAENFGDASLLPIVLRSGNMKAIEYIVNLRGGLSESEKDLDLLTSARSYNRFDASLYILEKGAKIEDN